MTVIQIVRFPQGGFGIHKISGRWKGTASAWFDKNGKIIDAEQVVNGRLRPVVKNRRMWQELAKYGPRCKGKGMVGKAVAVLNH